MFFLITFQECGKCFELAPGIATCTQHGELNSSLQDKLYVCAHEHHPPQSTPTPTEPRERETSTVDDGIGTKSAPALHVRTRQSCTGPAAPYTRPILTQMQTPREIVDLDGTNRSWVRVFKVQRTSLRLGM